PARPLPAALSFTVPSVTAFFNKRMEESHAVQAAQKRGPDECQSLKACRPWLRRALAWRLPGRQERMRVGDQRVIARYPSRCKNKKAPASRGLVWRKIASPIRLSSSTVGEGLSQGPGFS